jgi:superfamily II DNA or RNA helicase
LVHARITLLPFQIEPVLALLAGRRRLLLADGVGMGKTVQAGLLLRAVLDAHPEARALVVAPATLHRQWVDELSDRFGLEARVADSLSLARLRAATPYLASPWTLPGAWLASPDFLKQPHIIEGLPRQPWDLLVVDEAHQLSGDSQRHDAIHQLASEAARVALLTATPHDGDEVRFRRLLSIGARDDALTTFRRHRTADTDTRRVRWLPVPLAPEDHRVLDAIDAFERAVRPSADTTRPADGLPLICAVFRRRALSSPAALRASIARRLAVLEQAPRRPEPDWRQPDLFDSVERDDFGGDEVEALMGHSGLPLGRERAWLLRLQHLCARQTVGGRGRALAVLLRRAPDRVVIFTHYRDSLQTIRGALPAGRSAALMHGGQTPAEQHHALQAFLGGHVDTLVATDVASQGLNLHTTARWALSFDVPWTPLRLEQRIGRVDRIGQLRRVHATILTSRHPFDRTLKSRLDARSRESAEAPLTTCRRWAHAAEFVARAAESQRGLAGRWRHGPAPAVCDALVPAALTRRWLGHAGRGIACYELPFVTPNGDVIERRVVAVELGASVEALLTHAARRARVLTHRLEVRTALRRRTRPPEPSAAQSGLFDRRVPIPPPPAATDVTATGGAATVVSAGTPRLIVRLISRGA